MSAKKENPDQSKQYANSGKFNARIHLHKTYSTNPYPWPLWVFDQFPKKDHLRVLELGGGNGLLWMANAERIPNHWNITITDKSAGMLQDAQRNLAHLGEHIQWSVMDAEEIHYPEESFDIVIANHMLYHIGNLGRALSEIGRVLKKNGTFYASTIGSRNMAEMKELVKVFNPDSQYDSILGMIESKFSMENGKQQLENAFTDVRLYVYEDSLSITDSDAIVEYVLSMNGLEEDKHVMSPQDAQSFKVFLDGKMKESNGKIHISKASGMFSCTNARIVHSSRNPS
ncbi:class I SAM-dependent methyltransferase [Paenibacillus pabuli]|uniref:class I SAM-dependent methyltransferase n=1 Tax=Paenibacillus pabuli TaxID=1472 RepID=UPI003CE6D5AF